MSPSKLKIKMKTVDGKDKGSADLPEAIFGVEPNVAVMHQVVTAQLAAARQGTHSTKTRGEVRGGGRKPYRQKGTGRARQGSTRAPQFVGGGISHGPQPRDYSQRTPKKMKAAALRGALSDRARAGLVHVVSGFVDGDTASTKAARAALTAIVGSEPRRALVVLQRGDELSWLSLRNLPSVHVLAHDQLNTYDVLVNDIVVFTETALAEFLDGPIAVPTRASQARAEAAGDEPVVLAKSAPSTSDTAEANMAKAESSKPAAEEAPFGPGSHLPLDDGSEPDGFPIKGNADSMLYHVPGSASYKRTVAEVWFASADAAEKAGFQLPPSQRDEEDK
jgi:large subunit ribosomal protein L4